MLEILDDLHGLDPSVIHRDIKPSNVLRRPDGSYVLVDFGGVRVALLDDQAGSTIIGSHGHMAQEQLMGRAEPASDLYRLGVTLVHLLNRKAPSDRTTGMELDFSDHIRISDEFEQWLNGMLEPLVEDRFASAREALVAIEGQETSVGDDFESSPDPPQANAGRTWDCERLHVESQGADHLTLVYSSYRGLGGMGALLARKLEYLTSPSRERLILSKESLYVDTASARDENWIHAWGVNRARHPISIRRVGPGFPSSPDMERDKFFSIVPAIACQHGEKEERYEWFGTRARFTADPWGESSSSGSLACHVLIETTTGAGRSTGSPTRLRRRYETYLPGLHNDVSLLR